MEASVSRRLKARDEIERRAWRVYPTLKLMDPCYSAALESRDSRYGGEKIHLRVATRISSTRYEVSSVARVARRMIEFLPDHRVCRARFPDFPRWNVRF